MNSPSGNLPGPSRTAVVIGFVVAIALIHLFRVGSYLHGALFRLYYGYA